MVQQANKQLTDTLGARVGLEFRDGPGGHARLYDTAGEAILLSLISYETLAVMVQGEAVRGVVLSICNAVNRFKPA